MACFRECDIRGIYPDHVNEELFEAVGRSIARRIRGKGVIVTGHDVRIGSPSLASALIAGMVDEGGHVLDLGRVPTPILYFARRHWDAAAGVMVTASHNPPEHNGIKLIFRDGPATAADILQIHQDLRSDSFRPESGGYCQRIDALNAYGLELERSWQLWNRSSRQSRMPRIVADPGHGAWSKLAGMLLKQLGIPCLMLHDEPDGRFPGRSPDCTAPGCLGRLGQAVRESGAEAGLAWDGDGDRLAIIDRSGTPLTADQVGLVLMSSLPLRGERVLLDVKVSRKVRVAIEESGGIPVIERSAHCALERTMIDQDCLFGCEFSGHYFFRELHGADDGLYSAARFIHVLAAHESIETMLSKLPRFCITPDIRVPGTPTDFEGLQACLLSSPSFHGAKVSKLDGLKLELPDGWILVRQSVSEDKLSVRAEGETPDDLARLISLAVSALPAAHHELRRRLQQLELGVPA